MLLVHGFQEKIKHFLSFFFAQKKSPLTLPISQRAIRIYNTKIEKI